MSDGTSNVWLEKQNWARRLRRARLSDPHKTLGMVILDRAHGDLLTCWPDTKLILDDGGWSSSSGLSRWRGALVECGAIGADLDRHGKSGKGWENYTYTINLDWDGSVPEHLQPKPRGQKPKPKPEIHPKDSSVMEYVRARKEAEAPSTAPLEASVSNAESESVPESPKQLAAAQKPVKGRPRDASGLSGWGTETAEPKPTFDLNAQVDEIEREQREKSKRDDLETVPPSGALDDRLAGW